MSQALSSPRRGRAIATTFSAHVAHAEITVRLGGGGSRFVGELTLSEGRISILVQREPLSGGPRGQVSAVEELAPHELAAFADCLAALVERARADGIVADAPDREAGVAREA